MYVPLGIFDNLIYGPQRLCPPQQCGDSVVFRAVDPDADIWGFELSLSELEAGFQRSMVGDSFAQSPAFATSESGVQRRHFKLTHYPCLRRGHQRVRRAPGRLPPGLHK